MFAGEHPGPIGFHGQVPTRRCAPVQVGPRDDGPADVAEAVLLREDWRSSSKDFCVGVRLIDGGVILRGVVFLRQWRLRKLQRKHLKTDTKNIMNT